MDTYLASSVCVCVCVTAFPTPPQTENRNGGTEVPKKGLRESWLTNLHTPHNARKRLEPILSTPVTLLHTFKVRGIN